MKSQDLNDEELLRYSRHILLDQIGIEGQSRIAGAKVLVIGAGGLGCPSALYLASAGIGTLYLADDDEVDLTNLQRQILHTTSRVGMSKVYSAQQFLRELNPHVNLVPIAHRLEGTELEQAIANVDVVIDCCDNFKTRYAINYACVKLAKPLVSGAAIRLSGQLAVFELNNPMAPCYHCLFPEGEEVIEERCSTMGVFAPLTGIIGTLQASETLKILTGFEQPLFSTLQLFDSRNNELRKIKFHKDPQCSVCSLKN
jgi:adenylyltransferase/sulfurtransferase